MIRIKLNSSKNIGIVYHFTSTLDRLESILTSGKIYAGRTTLDKPFVCIGRSAPEIYLKRHIHDWNYGIMLDGEVITESYALHAYESYAQGLQDVLLVLRQYKADNRTYYTVQGGDEKPYSVGINTARALMTFARGLEDDEEQYYQEIVEDRDEASVFYFDAEDETEYPSIKVQGSDVPIVGGLEIMCQMTMQELPKDVQGILVKSGYEAEERIWLAERHKKSPYAQKDDILVSDKPFVDISRAILGVCFPKSEMGSEDINSFCEQFSNNFKRDSNGNWTSGKWKLQWYND